MRRYVIKYERGVNLAKKEKRASWWKDRFKRKPDKETQILIDVLSGKTPMYFTDFGENIYASDVVQQAIYSIVTELKKLDPIHVRKIGGDLIGVEGNIQSVLDAPNPLMTTSDFIEKIAWTLLLNYNAFIYPIWDGDTLTALYPLQPSEVDFAEDAAGTLFVIFKFPNGYEGQVPYEDVIHLRYKFSVSEFMGGDEWGQPNIKPILDTLKLNDTLLKGLAKSLHIQTTINGLIKLRTVVNMDDKMKKVKEFEERLKNNESGFLATDNIEEFTPITKSVSLLDNTVLEFIDKKIARNWGVSRAIMDGDFSAEQLQAFYQKAIEHIVKSWGQAFTKGLFSKRQTNGYKNEIRFLTMELYFMNTAQKLEMVKEFSPSGTIMENEKRMMFGMRPLSELNGVRMVSLNFINAKDASKYQVGENKNTSGGESND